MDDPSISTVVQYIIIGVIAVLGMLWKKITQFGSYLWSLRPQGKTSVVSDTDYDDSINTDIEALTYLVNRAIELGNPELVGDIKAVNAKIFNSYCDKLVSAGIKPESKI